MRHHAPETTRRKTPRQRRLSASTRPLRDALANVAGRDRQRRGRPPLMPRRPPAGYVSACRGRGATRRRAPSADGEIGADLEAGAGGAEELKGGGSTKRTKEQAVALVDKHVEPKECFVWYENNKVGWAPMPGTGCAHWVAHQLNFTDGLKCDKGFTVRVRNITAGRSKVEMKDVKAGDLWENPTDASHIGIIRTVNQENGKVTGVEVEHDSVRSGGVVKSVFTEGLFYR